MIPDHDDAALLERASAWTGDADPASLSAARLLAITRLEGIDFATALLYDRILRVPANAAFNHAVQHPNPIHADLIGIVPGAFHQEHRDTGANGDRILRIARNMGIEAAVIPTPGFGRLDANAGLLRDWLTRHPGRRILLVSLSKGSAEVKRALSMEAAHDAFASVTAWVSLSGLTLGTPLIDWLSRRRLRWAAIRALLWWRGHPHLTMEDLRHDPEALPSAWPPLPSTLQAVHVCGFPLKKHLTHRWAGRAWQRLAPLGPNDGGGILLADCARIPGPIYPIWASDHYLNPAWDVTPLIQQILGAATSLTAHDADR